MEKYDAGEITDRLRQVIGDEGSNVQLAALIDEPLSRLTDVLRGKTRPPVDMLFKLFHACGVDLNWFVAGAAGVAPFQLEVAEAGLLQTYRSLSPEGRAALLNTAAALRAGTQAAGKKNETSMAFHGSVGHVNQVQEGSIHNDYRAVAKRTRKRG